VRCPLRYKGVGAFGGVEPSTVESQSTVLPLHYERQERAVLLGSLCGGGGSRTPNRVSRGGSLAPSCIPFCHASNYMRIQTGQPDSECDVVVENRGFEPLASCLQGRRSPD
jgi:hypothetical protein